jgi:hypothetical protein
VFGPYAVLIVDCAKVEFLHLAIRTQAGLTNSAVRFVGEGSSWWTDVALEAEDQIHSHPALWLDSGADSAADSRHYWYGVEAEVKGGQASGFWVTGSTHEFRGSEIEVESEGGIVYGAIFGSGQFDVSVQSSTLAIHDVGPSLAHLAVVYFSNAAGLYPPCSQARFSMEGSRVSGTTTESSGTVQGLRNACQNFVGKVSARGTQFDLSGPIVQRLFGQGHEAPYALGSGANPPALGTSWATKGQDTFVETDCSSSLCTDTSPPSPGSTRRRSAVAGSSSARTSIAIFSLAPDPPSRTAHACPRASILSAAAAASRSIT